MSDLSIRDAEPASDADACAEIYAPYVEESIVSFEERAPDAAEMRGRIEGVAATHPWLVAEHEGGVVGPAYRWTVGVSVYVAPGEQGRGVGRALYTVLFDRLRERGFRMAHAGITLPNEASVALHESFGFEQIGINREIGWKHGAWRDVGWWQLELTPAGYGPPPEPR
jgi:L-amino acid N-acyltransferase YncA